MTSPIKLTISLILNDNEDLGLKPEKTTGTLIIDASQIIAIYSAVSEDSDDIGACIVLKNGETFVVKESVVYVFDKIEKSEPYFLKINKVSVG